MSGASSPAATRRHREAFAQRLWAVAEYYGTRLSTAQLELYWQCLREWPLDRLDAAIRRHLDGTERDSTFMPKVSDLRRALGESAEDHGIQAWGLLLAAAAQHGRYSSVDFGGAANAALRDVGGWSHLCGLEEARLGPARQAFIKAYSSYSNGRATPPESRATYHPGLIELDCARLGAPSPEVVRYLEPGTAASPAPQIDAPAPAAIAAVVRGVSETLSPAPRTAPGGRETSDARDRGPAARGRR